MRILWCILCKMWLLPKLVFSDERVVPPSIIKPQGYTWSDNPIYKRGDDVTTINCQATGFPSPRYMWTRNGEEVTNEANEIEYDKKSGDLILGRNFHAGDDGVYQCLAANSQGTSMTPFLEIYFARASPYSGADTTNKGEGFEGKYLALTCKNTPTSVPAHEFKWKTVDDNNKETVIESNDRLIIDPSGTLHFLWLEQSDKKNYVCGYYNTIMKVDSWNTVTEEVDVKPESIVQNIPPTIRFNEDVVVRAGNNAVLSCIFSYYSKNGNKLYVKWTFGGKQVQNDTQFQYLIRNVQLPSDKENNEGRYLCEAVVDGYEVKAHVNLKIIGPPQFKEGKELKAIWVPKGQDAVFDCQAYSHNSHVYGATWLMNGLPIIGCLPSQFECRNKAPDNRSICLPMSKRCDDYPDCDDQSDEDRCPNKVSCPEDRVACNGRCIPKGQTCTEVICEYPDFLCRNQQSCLKESDVCNGVNDCGDNSDESACENGEEIDIKGFKLNSQRTQMTIPKVKLDQSLCVQCVVSNEYGTSFGDGCLTVIDNINIVTEPNNTYTVKPGMFLNVGIDATTDSIYAEQLNYEWYWYREVEHPDSKKVILTEPVKLPPSGYEAVFQLSMNGKNLTIVVPDVDKEDKNSYEAYMDVAGGEQKYSVIVKHPYDKVVRNFTVTGAEVERPVVIPATAQASSNLWLIAVILGVVVLIALVIFIVCVVCRRDPRGAYYVDKKEHEAGNDPEQELKDSGFHDVGRVEDDDMDDKPEMEKLSLSESVKHYESDDDITEEYGGDFDISSKFNEDGSFIGLYGDKKSKTAGSKEATV